VILANLIPAAPFVILVMTRFFGQIDPHLEAAARVFGAGTGRMFGHVPTPLPAPGILAASLLVLVRTIALFERTFLTVGPIRKRRCSRSAMRYSPPACARRSRSRRWR
jgi:putative spermidine/putrescine transport system permease protein